MSQHAAMILDSISYCRKRAIAYAREVPAGAYTRDSGIRAQYNVLYGCHLRHALGIDADWIRAQMRDLAATQLDNGFLPATETTVGSQHNPDYLRLHKSALFFQLAEEYGLEVRPPELGAIFSTVWLKNYLAHIDWRNIWLHSNILLGIATCADFSRRRGKAVAYIEPMADFLAAHVPPHGLWGLDRGASLLNAMAGTFHLVPILQSVGRPVPFPAELANRLLSLQTPDGFFCGPTGYSCIEYDAAYLLDVVYVALGSTGLAGLRRAAERLAAGLQTLQNPDGGFPEVGRPAGILRSLGSVALPALRHRDVGTAWWSLKKVVRLQAMRHQPFLNNSVRECQAAVHESNLFSTWFRLLALHLASGIAGGPAEPGLASCRVVGLNYAPKPSA